MKNSSITFANRSIEPERAEHSFGARALVKVIALYQRCTSARVSACRFYPSCSGYAREAIEIHGAGRGSALAMRRLSRCRPFGAHGVDLVPPAKQVGSTER